MSQNELKPTLDTLLKTAALASGFVKAHQRFSVGVRQRSSVRSSGKRRQNSARARQFLCRCTWIADQNFFAVKRVFRRQPIDGTLNGHLADLRRLHDAFDRIVIQHASAIRPVQEKVRYVRVRDECESNGM